MFLVGGGVAGGEMEDVSMMIGVTTDAAAAAAAANNTDDDDAASRRRKSRRGRRRWRWNGSTFFRVALISGLLAKEGSLLIVGRTIG